MHTFAEYVPDWLAWPMSALSTLSALAGAGLFFTSAAFADYTLAIWGGIAFVAAGLLWYVGDMAASNRPID